MFCYIALLQSFMLVVSISIEAEHNIDSHALQIETEPISMPIKAYSVFVSRFQIRSKCPLL